MSARISSSSQSGILIPGPGAHKPSYHQAELIRLNREQQEMVNRAKRYAMEQSIKNVLTKKTVTDQQLQQKAVHRHQALVLMCRVYVGSVSFEVKEETIKASFGIFGAIKSINMTWDPVTLKHKGFAFVEYELPEGAQLAIDNMNGLQLGGRQIRVGRPSNMPQAAPVIDQMQKENLDKYRIYVASVHPDLSEKELGVIFEPFGKVKSCSLATTPNTDPPMHRGYGFVEFEEKEAATEALTMNNLKLYHMVLRVCPATTPPEHLTVHGTLESDSAKLAKSMTEEGIQADADHASSKPQAQDQAPDSISHKNDESTSTDQSQSDSFARNAIHDKESPVIMLQNMVFADDLDNVHLDIYEECAKFGQVLQVIIYVDKCKPPEKDKVKIFVQFSNDTSAKAAKESLNGRYFAGQEIVVSNYKLDLVLNNDYNH